MEHSGIAADEALGRLRQGNSSYVSSGTFRGRICRSVRLRTAEEGQHPYAAVITCSDSRVIPEVIFSSGIGDIFVIRSAGNTVDTCILGSLEYAVGHMGVKLVVVMGHTGCGAIAEALRGLNEGHTIEIINDIRAGIGMETDPYEATLKNIRNSVRLISEDITDRHDVEIIGALYDIRTGKVEFIECQKKFLIV